jgi:hypothetical protein
MKSWKFHQILRHKLLNAVNVGTRRYGIYAQPSEVVYLVKQGASPSNETHYLLALEKMKLGNQYPSWFYFYTNDYLLENFELSMHVH